MKNCVVVSLLLWALLQSCIKDEPLNPEADIETFSVDSSALVSDVFIDQANRKIMLYLTPEAIANGVAPKLTLSLGATVSPASGDSIFFSSPVQYSVTSQSRENTKVYEVVVVESGKWLFNFENWGINDVSKYEYPLEPDGTAFWSSGNPGVALSGVAKDPSAYPTRSTSDGLLATKAAELMTIKGTPLSELVGIRLFAGSLFLGNFNSSVGLTAPLKATEFGQPYTGIPTVFSGYYKYTPGEKYQDESGTIIPGQTDECAIYAVLFKGTERLNGTNILTSDRIVARAVLPDGSAKATFTKFDIPFEFVQGADLSGNMMMAIVASSSKNGDTYRGAIGSRLVVDKLRIIN